MFEQQSPHTAPTLSHWQRELFELGGVEWPELSKAGECGLQGRIHQRWPGAEEVEELWFNAQAQHELAQLRGVEDCLALRLSSLCTSRVGVLDLGKQHAAGICSCLPVLLRGMAGAKGGAGVEEVLRGVAPSFYRTAEEDKAFLHPL